MGGLLHSPGQLGARWGTLVAALCWLMGWVWRLWVWVLLQHKEEVSKPPGVRASLQQGCPALWDARSWCGATSVLHVGLGRGWLLGHSSQHCCTRVSLVQAMPAVLTLLLGSGGLCGARWTPPRDPQGVCGDQLSRWEQTNPMLCS